MSAFRTTVMKLLAGDRDRTGMASLEGVWRTAVRAAELETLMLLSSRGCPLFTVANGPLMARRSHRHPCQPALREPLQAPPASMPAISPGCKAKSPRVISNSQTSSQARPRNRPTNGGPHEDQVSGQKAAPSCF